MEYIVLDTNIFLKENFLEGKRIRGLLKLSEEEKIKIVLTEITIGEVKSNFRKSTRQALKNLAEFRKPFESRVLRNNSIGKTFYDKIDKNTVENEFNNDFDAILRKSKVEIIVYRDVNIKKVFEKYFNEEYPFNGTDKKNEFPDAFALDLIEKWCEEKGVKCKVFSDDKDFLNYKSNLLDIKRDYEEYLNEKLQFFLTKEKRLTILEKLFVQNSSIIDKEIEQWYFDKLDDTGVYYDVIWYEIHDIEVTEVLVKDKSYEIVATDEEWIEIEVEVNLTFKVEVTIDDEEFSIYDDEDKVTHYFETKTEEIIRDATAKISLLAYITDEENFKTDFEVLEINKDVNLEIKSEYNDYR
jgi:hypothetical protein